MASGDIPLCACRANGKKRRPVKSCRHIERVIGVDRSRYHRVALTVENFPELLSIRRIVGCHLTTRLADHLCTTINLDNQGCPEGEGLLDLLLPWSLPHDLSLLLVKSHDHGVGRAIRVENQFTIHHHRGAASSMHRGILEDLLPDYLSIAESERGSSHVSKMNIGNSCLQIRGGAG